MLRHSWAAIAMALAATPAFAGAAHILLSQTLQPTAADAGYAVDASLDEEVRSALTEGLQRAGLRVTPPDQAHAYLVTVHAAARALCSAACSSLVNHDDAPLSDYFRHGAVVAAQANTGARASADGPVAWYTVLQSDGLSERTKAYLPTLLRYGARAYGRDTGRRAPPQLAPPTPLLPGVLSGPGA